MMKRIAAPLIVGALVLGGCETSETETPDTTIEDTVGTDTAADLGELETNTGELSSINRSGVRGTARVERDGDDVRVIVEAEGLEAGAEYSAQVHEGRCTDDGAVVLDAGVLTSGDDGSGSLQFSGGSAGILDEGDVSVLILGPDDEAVACADAAAE